MLRPTRRPDALAITACHYRQQTHASRAAPTQIDVAEYLPVPFGRVLIPALRLESPEAGRNTILLPCGMRRHKRSSHDYTTDQAASAT
ncbi:hypothetical protein BASA62_007608 [Batrachochytrium salamandrivorans]|nr:hypothetical protein BASA62_007608 [Batrachochytrium salamandrivorans]